MWFQPGFVRQHQKKKKKKMAILDQFEAKMFKCETKKRTDKGRTMGIQKTNKEPTNFVYSVDLFYLFNKTN